ncbi:MAG: response regulator [Bdellovibrionales bacterium]|nr:response regulator [Bdellovibrionales bacterium]
MNPATTNMKYNILVVDDDESMRFMMQTKLFQSGYNVTLAASGSHAMQIFQSGKKFDLVLCDLKMPLKTGIDVIRYMKDNGIKSPTIIITGFPEREKIISAAQMGIHDVLVKPVRHQELMKMIEKKLLGATDEVEERQAS